MDHYKQEPRSLIMCVIPLQMLIAEKIIELNPNKKFDLLVLVLNDNDKYAYYYNKLKEKCIDSFYYIPKIGLNSFFDFIRQLHKMYKFFLVSVDSRFFQYIFSKTFA